VSPGGTNNTTLYAAGARFYAPGLGQFSQLDSMRGSAQNPLSMNRFLYAAANPTTLIDPDGHTFCTPSNFPDCDGFRPGGWQGPTPAAPAPPTCTAKDCKDDGPSDKKTSGATPPKVKLHLVHGVWVGPDGAPISQAGLDRLNDYCGGGTDWSDSSGWDSACKSVEQYFKDVRQIHDAFCQSNATVCQKEREAAFLTGAAILEGLLTIWTLGADTLLLGPVDVATASQLEEDATAISAAEETGLTSLYSARTSAGVTQSVIDGIDPSRFNPNARFGKAFYLAEEGGTSVLEVASHGGEAKFVIRFEFDLSGAKVLDLTNVDTAASVGYRGTYGTGQSVAEWAAAAGYNAILYPSAQGPGNNYAVLGDFDTLLAPVFVAPVP
jgi:RHS repeat-associated protein